MIIELTNVKLINDYLQNDNKKNTFEELSKMVLNNQNNNNSALFGGIKTYASLNVNALINKLYAYVSTSENVIKAQLDMLTDNLQIKVVHYVANVQLKKRCNTQRFLLKLKP